MHRRRAVSAGLALVLLALAAPARAEEPTPISFDDALARARAGAPDLVAARAREGVSNAEIGIAGQPPNPTVLAGTSTQAARLSAGVSLPLLLLGQRGAAKDAARAELVTVKIETEGTWNEVRSATAHAFVTLWLAESTAATRGEAAKLVKKLEDAVTGRVDAGAAPVMEGLRVRAERMRADADAHDAVAQVSSASSELARWVGAGTAELRALGDPRVPAESPTLGSLMARVDSSPMVRRERADARAAEARVSRERAFIRPAMTLDLGLDAADPTLPTTNYRAQLGVEVPLWHQRGPQIEREVMAGNAAQARANAERAHALSNLLVAFRTFEASTSRAKLLAEGVVPAAEAAANATEESYALGRAPLVAVLDAERTRIEVRLSLLEARAARASAWLDVEHAVGVP